MQMTVVMIEKHELQDRFAGYVSDTPTTMRSLWVQLKV